MKKRVVRFFNNIKIRKKLILTYLIVSIVPITILGLLCFRQTSNLLLEKEGYKQEESLEQVKSSLANQIQVYNNLSDYIAFNQTIEQVINYNYENFYDMYEKYTNLLDPLLSSLKYFHSDLQRVTIYTDKTTVEHDTTIAPLSEIKDTFWYSQVMNQSEILWFVDEKANSFFVRKLPEETGFQGEGLLYIDLKYDKLFEAADNLIGDNYGFYVIDRNGEAIFEKNEFDEEYENKILSSKEILLLDQGKSGKEHQYQVAKGVIESCGWTLYLYKPMDVISKSANSIGWMVVFAVAISIALVGLVGYAMSYLVMHRLEKLNQNMKEVEAGNLNVFVRGGSKDEIGELIESFKQMLHRIQFLIDEVYKGEIALRESEMKALQAQINPHFLYNSLSVINWKAIAANEMEISRLTLLLSSFYRTTLNKGGNTIMVRDELKNMDAYLEIQLIMHDYSFDVVREIDPVILDHVMPNLMLQPIVENAIAHGLDMKEDGKGCLTIIGKQKEDTFVFIIEDNGVGMDEEACEEILSYHSRGYGMRNVNSRINLSYKGNYGLKIESTIGVGTKVIMELPNKMG